MNSDGVNIDNAANTLKSLLSKFSTWRAIDSFWAFSSAFVIWHHLAKHCFITAKITLTTFSLLLPIDSTASIESWFVCLPKYNQVMMPLHFNFALLPYSTSPPAWAVSKSLIVFTQSWIKINFAFQLDFAINRWINLSKNEGSNK